MILRIKLTCYDEVGSTVTTYVEKKEFLERCKDELIKSNLSMRFKSLKSFKGIDIGIEK